MLKVDINKLIIARANIPMTVRELSKASGVAVSTISKIENGHAEPNLITIGKLAKALNIKVQDLLEN